MRIPSAALGAAAESLALSALCCQDGMHKAGLMTLRCLTVPLLEPKLMDPNCCTSPLILMNAVFSRDGLLSCKDLCCRLCNASSPNASLLPTWPKAPGALAASGPSFDQHTWHFLWRICCPPSSMLDSHRQASTSSQV